MGSLIWKFGILMGMESEEGTLRFQENMQLRNVIF